MNIKFCLLLILSLSVYHLNAQTTRGLSLPASSTEKPEGKTYALIVGISKYKNPAIPQLQYADRDAEAFRNYLVASGVDSNNITLLLNEKATNGEFWASLNYITDLAKQGDKVYIYFSGHGDVENKTVVKDAYLLPYDAPKCVYPAGAIAVPLLKSWIATFSANGIHAIFIADACRSGNLAGGREGMEATAAMLKDKWQDEVKVLSCQPGELSLEGKQWGGGRGLFSYELINGLAGMADRNKDGKVTLRELNLYLMEKVPEEANPMQQNPMLFGDAETVLSRTNAKMMAEIISGRNNTLLAAIDVKGFDESLLAGLNDEVKENYRLFTLYIDSTKYAIKKGDSLAPSAYYYLLRIPDDKETKNLRGLMKRNLCAGIMKRMDKKINTMMYNRMPEYSSLVELSYEGIVLRNILGDDKLRSLGYLSKALFFEVITIINTSKASIGLRKIDSAISLDPGAAYLYVLKGDYNFALGDKTGALSEYKKAISISPYFAFPYYGMYTTFKSMNQPDSMTGYVQTYVECLLAFDNSHTIDSLRLALDYGVIGDLYAGLISDHNLAIKFYEMAFAIKSENNFEFYYNATCSYSMINNKPNALMYLERSLGSGYKDFKNIANDPDLDNIRHEPEFITLMKKYFPDQYKE